MSFFTNDAYASFRQHPPPLPAAAAAHQQTTTKPTPPATGQAKSLEARRLENASFSSSTSTASMLSELDPLSPVNLQRAADPWYGNTHVNSTNGYHHSSASSSSSPPGAAHPNNAPKVFIGDDLDDEWGEFTNAGSFTVMESLASASPFAELAPNKRPTAASPSSAYENFELSHAGWSRLDPSSSDAGHEPTSLFDEDDDLNDGGLLPYQLQVRAPPGSFSGGALPQPAMSFVKTLLTRLGSFGSLSAASSSSQRSLPPSPSSAALATTSSRRGSLGSFTGSSSSLPTRNYDAYDVTFEKGPIGLELETDWYGRQAVVKGFKKVTINNSSESDGLAKTCGLIRIGDVLTAINGVSCLELGFQETLAKLRLVSPAKHTLHFKSLEAAGDLSIYNQDADIIQAKKFIHQHKEKFYKAPVPLADKQLILGCVERLVGEKVTAFNFHRQDTGEFLLACSCVNERTGGFLFHTLQDSHLREWKDLPMNEDSAVFLGRLIPNFLGTEFILIDHQQKRRNELGFIEYNTNVMGRVPNFLKIAFPKQPHEEEEEEEEEEGSEEEDKEKRTRQRAATVDGSMPSSSSGMGSNNAVFNTHVSSSMMDKNGTISERYKRLKQTRTHSLVEKLRSFSLDDMEIPLDFSSIGSNSQNSSGMKLVAAGWHDDDDHAGKARAMRMKQLRTQGALSRRDTMTPYGAVEQEDFDSDLICFETRQPSWNEELGAWTLNFQGRVKLASKKNFLIVAEQGNDAMEKEFGEDTTYLRFGKVTKMRFTLDFQAPLSPILALAIACSSFAHKIAVT